MFVLSNGRLEVRRNLAAEPLLADMLAALEQDCRTLSSKNRYSRLGDLLYAAKHAVQALHDELAADRQHAAEVNGRLENTN